jgi:hypothetical protein
MKMLMGILFVLLSLSVNAQQQSCSVAVKDRFSGVEYELLTRYSYSRDAACSDAISDCHDTIRMGQSYGRYYDAFCEIKGNAPIPPNPPTRPPFPPTGGAICTTDLVDSWGGLVRSFRGEGWTLPEACRQSDDFCYYELSRGNSRGVRCETRGNGGGHYPPPPPPRDVTETCTANRHDPAGYFIESYYATFTGPRGTDVKGEACRQAHRLCSSEIRGRQTCRIAN